MANIPEFSGESQGENGGHKGSVSWPGNLAI